MSGRKGWQSLVYKHSLPNSTSRPFNCFVIFVVVSNVIPGLRYRSMSRFSRLEVQDHVTTFMKDLLSLLSWQLLSVSLLSGVLCAGSCSTLIEIVVNVVVAAIRVVPCFGVMCIRLWSRQRMMLSGCGIIGLQATLSYVERTIHLDLVLHVFALFSAYGRVLWGLQQQPHPKTRRSEP